jgi:hypothetical protein
MQRQNEKVESFLGGHRDFIRSLSQSIDMLEKDIKETAEMERICTDEWCLATEHCLDEVANDIYSISEPRWSSNSGQLRAMRRRVHDLYAHYRGAAHA